MEIVLFVLMGVYGIFAIHFGLQAIKEDSAKIWSSILLITGMIAVSVSIPTTGAFIERKHPVPIAASKFKGRTEIVTTRVNGVETSRDTLYIFTPRKDR
jgi:hypothetical protein